MLKDYEFDDDDYKPDELQNDGVVLLNCIFNKLPIQTFMMEPNYFIGKRVSPGAF